jgi:Fur family transcriptional regulator, ferric uptake regulator
MEQQFNLRFSKNRQYIIEILESEKIPLCVDFIFEKLRLKNKSVSLSTVYRILEKLVINNTVVKTIFGDDLKAKFELNRQGHKHYLICTECNDMVPIHNCPIGEIEKSLQENTGFYIKGHKLEVYGHCAKCHG